MRESLVNYWTALNDGDNDTIPYLRPNTWLRSVHLYDIINSLIPPSENPAIMEIGCNVGRNLMILKFGNYNNLTGIELSEKAISLMHHTFPVSTSFKIHTGPVEQIIYTLDAEKFDIIFTMAVLEHLPPESEHVFPEIVRTCKKYLITIEDERWTSWRHFPRRYDNVFKPLGMKQIKVIKEVSGLSKNIICRIFRKED